MKALLVTILFVCSFWTTPSFAKLNIVATTPDLAAIARTIGGSAAEVTALALHTQDPHWVDARPHLALKLSKADLLLIVGLGLESGWLPTLQTGSRNSAIQEGGAGFLDCSSLIQALDIPPGPVDPSAGHVHPGGSPHYLLDPGRAEKVAVGIGKRLAKLDPTNHLTYFDNTKRFIESLRKARQAWTTQLKSLGAKRIIAYHKSLSYLAAWTGLQIIEHVEPRPGIPPNPQHVASVLQTMRKQNVSAVVQESWHPTKTSKLLASKSSAKFVAIAGSPNFDAGQDYLAFMNGVVNSLVRGLQ